jgi:hypothetical protein
MIIALAIVAFVSSATVPVIVIFLPDFCPYEPVNAINIKKIQKTILIFIILVLTISNLKSDVESPDIKEID